MNKEVRKAVERAENDPRFRVVPFKGHTWAKIECRHCGRDIKVFSTGKAPEQGAKYLRNFLDKHSKH